MHSWKNFTFFFIKAYILIVFTINQAKLGFIFIPILIRFLDIYNKQKGKLVSKLDQMNLNIEKYYLNFEKKIMRFILNII